MGTFVLNNDCNWGLSLSMLIHKVNPLHEPVGTLRNTTRETNRFHCCMCVCCVCLRLQPLDADSNLSSSLSLSQTQSVSHLLLFSVVNRFTALWPARGGVTVCGGVHYCRVCYCLVAPSIPSILPDFFGIESLRCVTHLMHVTCIAKCFQTG